MSLQGGMAAICRCRLSALPAAVTTGYRWSPLVTNGHHWSPMVTNGHKSPAAAECRTSTPSADNEGHLGAPPPVRRATGRRHRWRQPSATPRDHPWSPPKTVSSVTVTPRRWRRGGQAGGVDVSQWINKAAPSNFPAVKRLGRPNYPNVICRPAMGRPAPIRAAAAADCI